VHVGATLAHEVDAGDAAVDDTVLDVFGNVGCPNEQHLHRRVAAGERERPVAGLLGPEPRVLEQVEGRLAQAPLGREREPQEAARSRAAL